MPNETSIPVYTDDADLDDPRTTFGAWQGTGDGEGHIICVDECDGSREQAIEHAQAYLAANPEAVDVYVWAFTPTS